MNRNTRNLQILREKVGVEQFKAIAELLNKEHLTFGAYTVNGFTSKEEQRNAIMKDFYHGYSWDDLKNKYGLTMSALYKITQKRTQKLSQERKEPRYDDYMRSQAVLFAITLGFGNFKLILYHTWILLSMENCNKNTKCSI